MWSVPTGQVSLEGVGHPWAEHSPAQGSLVPLIPMSIAQPAHLFLVPAETAWNVSVSVRGLQLHLRLISSVPAAFSATLCQHRGGQCQPEAPLYTVTGVSSTGLGGDTQGTLTCADPALVLCSQRALLLGSWHCCCQCRSWAAVYW